ncbi:MAG: hydrolase [Planctomycetes bacterium]|nr:hydrolase [Planctomycetota bacterium]
MDTRHPTIARAGDSALVVIDCQERLWRVISGAEVLERQLAILMRGARILQVPVVVTEQYPKGLGPTVQSLKDAAGDAPVLEKMTFSCAGDDGFQSRIRELERGTVVVCGIEAHICVLQTALDLLADGYAVQVVADGIGTRAPSNRDVALRRLEQAGAVITCVESLLFEWMERCDAAAFKEIQGLLK